MRRLVLVCLALTLVSGCVSRVGGAPRAVETPPTTTTTTPTWEPPPKVGRYAAGDCVVAADQTPVPCGQPHEYEVMLSDHLPAGVPDTYPPELDTVVGPVCIATIAEYTGNPDADASRLQAAYLWPDPDEWTAGQRWFACLVSEDDVTGTVQRTGSVRDVLADGLGDLRQCLEGKPADAGPSRSLPCDQPHHSEAVEPVIVLGKVADPAPSQDEILAKTNDPCRAAVREYLGGQERAGISWGMTYGSPEQWKQGFVTATCFAVSEQPVTGTLAG
jgi:hypothetical protein